MSNKKGRYRRGRRRNKKGFSSWSLPKKIGLIFGVIALLILTTGGIYAASKLSKIEKQDVNIKKLHITKDVDYGEGYLNIALFGLDSREGTLGKGNRSDTIMIASLNKKTGEVKLVSVFRDTLLEMEDGTLNKANAAYAIGGPEEAIAMINKNLDMDIEKYIAVNFNALVDVIDAVGGLDIELSYEEIIHTNNYCIETSKITGKGFEKIDPPIDGTYHLNGVQAVSYSRIRRTAGGDFARTKRQRLVLEKIAEKVRKSNLGTLNKIIDSVFPQVSTNFTTAEMFDYAKDILHYKIGESMGFPETNLFDNMSKVGSVVLADDLATNVRQIHRFLFGDDGYEVSETVRGIQSKIEGGNASDVSDTSYGEEDNGEDDYYPQGGGNDWNIDDNPNNSNSTGTGEGTDIDGGNGDNNNTNPGSEGPADVVQGEESE